MARKSSIPITDSGSRSSSRRSPYSVSGLLYQSRMRSETSSARVSAFESRFTIGTFTRNCTREARVIAETKPLAVLYSIGSER